MKTIRGFFDYAEENPEQRYGQAFVNYFEFLEMPELFYETDDGKAMMMIGKIINEYQLPYKEV